MDAVSKLDYIALAMVLSLAVLYTLTLRKSAKSSICT